MAADYILYGGDHSLYSGKVRAYLRFKGLNWEEVTASREIYRRIILPKVGAAIVPVLATADGRYVQDSTDIIDFLEAAHPTGSLSTLSTRPDDFPGELRGMPGFESGDEGRGVGLRGGMPADNLPI